MASWTIEPQHELNQLIRGVLGERAGVTGIKASPLTGGIDSAGVARVAVRYRDHRGRDASKAFVWKRLAGTQVREARVYGEILGREIPDVAPSLADVRQAADERWLLLEPIRPASRWPWRKPEAAAGVLGTLARLHASALGGARRAWLDEWDYERELSDRSAQLVRALAAPAGGAPERICLRASLPAVERLASNLAAWRTQLRAFSPLAPTFIHGDVHPGNVMVRRIRGGVAPVLIDWARSRIGSPLEDVSSWLQSLGYWEPVARQRHDSLLASYLMARGMSGRLERDLRDAYWLAAASNLLAGAILFHLGVADNPATPSARRAAAIAAAADGLRVIRRADACWSEARRRRGSADANGRRSARARNSGRSSGGS